MPKIRQETLGLADALHSAAIHLLRLVRTEDRTTGVGPAPGAALRPPFCAGRRAACASALQNSR